MIKYLTQNLKNDINKKYEETKTSKLKSKNINNSKVVNLIQKKKWHVFILHQ